MVQEGTPEEEELDLLDALAQLDIRPPYQSNVSTPPRTSSHQTRTSPRISPRGSDHSLRSSVSSSKSSIRSSVKAKYQRSSSALSRALQREIADADSEREDNGATPSVRQSGFISPGSQLPKPEGSYARTSSDSVRAAHDTSSPASLSSATSSQRPRLLARAPCNEARPGDDLVMFQELEASSKAGPSRLSTESQAADDASLRSGRSSVLSDTSLLLASKQRINRLRKDIALEAHRIRERTSLEELRRNAEAASALEQRFNTESVTATTTASPGEGFSLINRSLSRLVGSSAQDDAASVGSYKSFDAASFTSLHESQRSLSAREAGSTSTYSLSGELASSARREGETLPMEHAGGKTRRPRPRETREWTQVCWLWCSHEPSRSKLSSSGLFGKAPVPSALKRKSNKRESTRHLSPAEALQLLGAPDASPPTLSSKGKARDKKSKVEEKMPARPLPASSTDGPASPAINGRWKRVSAVLRDDGYLRIYSDSDNSILHTVRLTDHDRYDIQLVDHSLFGRPNCLCIESPGGSTKSSTPHRSSLHASTLSLPLPPKLHEPIYLCMPSLVTTHVWLVMARCFASPEDASTFGSPSLQRLRPVTRSADDLLLSDDDEAAHATRSDVSSDKSYDGFRTVRSLHITINEARGLGDAARYPSRPSTDERDETVGPTTYCEIEVGGAVVGQTSMRSGQSPFWNETFAYKDLAPMLEPARIRLLHTTKTSSPARLVGLVELRLADMSREKSTETWLAVRGPNAPAPSAAADDELGELSVSTRVSEEVVLPLSCYSNILQMLREDEQAGLVTEIAAALPHELEETTHILLRILTSQSLLVDRIDRLAQVEVEMGLRQNRSAAILFRGNTILTKSVEFYLRLIGAEYLDASIGDVVRRICADKVEIEIDPLKLRAGAKEKEILRNMSALQELTKKLWDAIYRARGKCPRDLRLIFSRIQAAVVSRYDQVEEQKNTRYTCISAFIFLRFFVPAVLNPRLFSLVSNTPDPKSQRTLTLVAKSLQGLANFSSFGQKEPWMQPMNAVVSDCSEGLVDFLEYVSTPADPTAHRQEWTSPHAAVYTIPNRLRDALPPISREEIPSLPHLVDLPKELGVLARRLARVGDDTPSAVSSRAAFSPAFQDLIHASIVADNEARRRGGALAGQPLPAFEHHLSPVDGDPAGLRLNTSDEPPSPDEPAGVQRRETSSNWRQNHRSYTISGPGPGTLTLTSGSFPGRSFSSEDLSALANLGSVDDVLAAKVHTPAELRAAIGKMRRGSEPRVEASPRLPRAPGPPRSPVLGISLPSGDLNLSPKTRVRASQRLPVLSTVQPTGLETEAARGANSDLRLPPPRSATASVRILQETVTTESYLSEPLPVSGVVTVDTEVGLGRGEATEPFCLSPTSDEIGAGLESSFGRSPYSAPLVGVQRGKSSGNAHGWTDDWTGFSASSSGAIIPNRRGLTSSTSLASTGVAADGISAASSSSEDLATAAAERAIRRASPTGMAKVLLNRPPPPPAVGSTPAPAPAVRSRDRVRASLSGVGSRDERGNSGEGKEGGGGGGGGVGGGFFGRALGRKGSRAV